MPAISMPLSENIGSFADVKYKETHMFECFQSFIKKMMGSFRRIAAATKNEMTVDDLQQEAWLMAHDIGKKRGREIDFSSPEDESLIIRALYHRNVKRGDWKLRKAVRIDKDVEGDESAINWSERLPARESSDPLIALMHRESEFDSDGVLASSYSQAAAYVLIFFHFGNDKAEISAYLVISVSAFNLRLRMAQAILRVQPSLFDRIERIDNAFMPLPGRQYAIKAVEQYSGTQWGWIF